MQAAAVAGRRPRVVAEQVGAEDLGRAGVGLDAAAGALGVVARDVALHDAQGALVVEDAAAGTGRAGRGVAGDGAAAHGQVAHLVVEAATALVGDMEILVPMAGLIDKDAEIERLSKEIDKLRKEVGRAEVKLKNPKFVDKAPQAVVDKEKAKLDDYRSQLAKLEEQLEKIKYL